MCCDFFVSSQRMFGANVVRAAQRDQDGGADNNGAPPPGRGGGPRQLRHRRGGAGAGRPPRSSSESAASSGGGAVLVKPRPNWGRLGTAAAGIRMFTEAMADVTDAADTSGQKETDKQTASAAAAAAPVAAPVAAPNPSLLSSVFAALPSLLSSSSSSSASAAASSSATAATASIRFTEDRSVGRWFRLDWSTDYAQEQRAFRACAAGFDPQAIAYFLQVCAVDTCISYFLSLNRSFP